MLVSGKLAKPKGLACEIRLGVGREKVNLNSNVKLGVNSS